MRRAGWIAAAIVGWSVCASNPGFAQAPPPEGWVVLSIDEYRTLRDRSLGIGSPPPVPLDGTLSRVEYDLRVDGESAMGRALLTVDVLRDGWARIPIPTGLRVTDARIDGDPVAVVAGTPPYVLLSKTGRAVVSLDVVIPLGAGAGTESMGLPLSAASITKTALLLPRSNVDLSVDGGFVTEHNETAEESRWTVYGRPSEALKLSWKHRVDDRRSSLPLRARAGITEIVGFGEDASQVAASVHVEVVQGVSQDIALALPAGLVINEVNGPTVADWQVADGTLRVHLLEPVSTETTFVVNAEMRTAREGRLTVPIVRMPAAERESGGIAVDVVGAGEIVERQASGIEPADPSELGEFVAARQSPSLIAFRFRPLAGADGRALSVTVMRYTPQAVLVANVEEARYRVLAAEERILIEARYAVRNNQRSFLKMSLPANATVWSANVDGQPIRPGIGDDNAVLLPLGKGRSGEDAPTSAVTVVYLQRQTAQRDDGRLSIALPAVDLPISRTGLRLYYPPRFKVTPEPGMFRIDSDAGPFADALKNAPVGRLPVVEQSGVNRMSGGLQGLVDRFRNQGGERRIVGALPVEVTFPEFGPSIFLATELTAEGRSPTLELLVKPAKH